MKLPGLTQLQIAIIRASFEPFQDSKFMVGLGASADSVRAAWTSNPPYQTISHLFGGREE
jgi:hypothetical protein